MVAGRKEAEGRNVLPSWHSPFPSVALSSWAFCFEGSALRMFSFSCTCRCDSLPSDVPFFIRENPRCVLQGGHTRLRNYQRIQTPAIFFQTKPAGRIFAIPPRQQRSGLAGTPGRFCGLGWRRARARARAARETWESGAGTCRDQDVPGPERAGAALLGTAAPGRQLGCSAGEALRCSTALGRGNELH